MTLVSTYNPSSEAHCPHCGELVKCDNIGGITFGTDPYLDFYHQECGTTWRWHMRTGDVESPIPKPMGLREMMGEENWHRMMHKEHLQRYAERMFEVLESITNGSTVGLQNAKELVAEINEKE